MNEELRNDVIVNETEEVNFLVVPEEVYNGEFEETEKGLNGVLIGAAIAATGVVAYKCAPKVINKVKSMWKKKTDETLEEKQQRLLEELAEVNSQISSENEEN